MTTTIDNPHYVTPEEAEKKYCPLKYSDCIGPKCMAWRWRPDGHQDLAQGYALKLPLVPEQPMTHGYCGMVKS